MTSVAASVGDATYQALNPKNRRRSLISHQEPFFKRHPFFTKTLAGFAIALLVRTATPLPAAVTPWSVGLGLFVSFSVGLFFGIFPAQKASKVDPIISLRYE
jgi:ABC-type lipoprotein release transport system permease subunit